MDDALHAQARTARDAIRAGTLTGAALMDALLAVPFRDRDVFVDEALALDAPPDDVPNLPPGTVPYVPCGVDAILHAVRDAPICEHDVFVDLGAGVGRVAVLVHLLTGARAVGVELQAPLVERAQRTIDELALHDVSIIVGDAADTDVPDGTVFFIYASFSQAVLARVLRKLEHVATQRRITLCAVGFDVHDQPWLTARASQSPELTLYDSR